MDFIVVIIVLAVIGSVITPVLIWGAIAYFAYKAIAKSSYEFQNMSPESQIKTLMYLQKKGQMTKARDYWGHLEGPAQMEIGNLASSLGWDPGDFYR